MTGIALALWLAAHGSLSGLVAAPSVPIRVDWQDPRQLPPGHRHHCTFDRWSGRPYCEDHCGRGYQFYYCSPLSFGCCHVARGYCGFDGILRCHP